MQPTETWNDVVISKQLPESKTEEVIKLMQKHKNILTNLPGNTTREKHTKDEPLRDRMYPIPYFQREVIRQEVEAMLSMGIIRKLKSPYAAPPVLVKKPDGSVRFCVNYKKMNSVTVFDGEPMPSPDDIYIKMRKGVPIQNRLDKRILANVNERRVN